MEIKKIGCKSCREAGSLGAMRTGKQRCSFSTEWQNCRVGPYGNSNEKQMKSLRKKINEHSVSQSHKLAQDIVKRQNEEALKSSFLKTQKDILASP